jgi:subtilisin family serine protease
MMTRDQIEELLYGRPNEERRFTQDFPILPDVWIAYAAGAKERVSLLLTPHNQSDAATLASALRERLSSEESPKNAGRVLYNESVVLAEFSFDEMLRIALPLTDWWANTLFRPERGWKGERNWRALARQAFASNAKPPKTFDGPLMRRFIQIVARIELARRKNGRTKPDQRPEALISAFAAVFAGAKSPDPEHMSLLWSISRNRPAHASVYRSRLTVKADAARRLFETGAAGITWAVLDTGIDARHPAFWNRDEKSKPGNPGSSRITRTYDFLRIKDLLYPGAEGDRIINQVIARRPKGDKERDRLVEIRSDLRRNLKNGRSIDWDLLEPFLRIPHDKHYVPPPDSHGTHVAGIIAADWQDAHKKTPLKEPLIGMCPEIELYDLRVLGGSDEFTIIAALQFIRHLNAHKDVMLIHGVNLSLSVRHEVANFACGRTPICEECERVVASGVVVVTAAGNRGFNKVADTEGGAEGDYRYISITDPGNAEGVITVGSTHRTMPHTYGVSYFSSRGPTGDGRTKPDLVAPGERIDSCAVNEYYETRDGTSMAAPHVSGAAALLLARNKELIGQPRRVKEILIKSATDLGREPRFQGGGNLDVLRALQSV